METASHLAHSEKNWVNHLTSATITGAEAMENMIYFMRKSSVAFNKANRGMLVENC